MRIPLHFQKLLVSVFAVALSSFLISKQFADGYIETKEEKFRDESLRLLMIATNKSNNNINISIGLSDVGSTNSNTTSTTTTNITVAFAISISSCNWNVIDAVAIHGYSIDLVQRQSSYSHRRYAFVHTNSTVCSSDLRRLGYIVLEREVPIRVGDIAKPYLREAIETNGCCGSKELLKLYVYTLNESVAVHLDTDMLLLQPIDELFDTILNGKSERNREVVTEENRPLPPNNHPVDFFFTRDYSQGPKNTNDTSRWAVQGGFLVVKTSPSKFRDILNVVLMGRYFKRGWAGSGIGVFWGGAQVQGLLPYIYLNDPSAVELDRCIYNNMADHQTFPGGPYEGRCTTLKANCSNCQLTPFSEIKLVHLTMCSKPWRCSRFEDRRGQCPRMLGKWFELRRELEAAWGRPFQPKPARRWFHNVSQGYCLRNKEKSKRYIQMQLPRDLNWSHVISLAAAP